MTVENGRLDSTGRNIRGFIRWFGAWLSVFVITAAVVMVGCKIGGALFDTATDKLPPNTSYDEKRSLDMCEAAHGTPVLESNGNAYKSCAINGKSETKNVVQ